MDGETRDYIEELELRLSSYHAELNEAVEQRDRLAIDAAWGVHGAFTSTLAVLLLLYVFDRFIGWHSWLGGIGVGVAIFAVQMVTRMSSNSARMKEVDTFATLPTWDSMRP